MIIIYTDGSSRGNPGPGGWGAVVIDGGKVTELGGREDMTTNNRMELSGAVFALENTREGSEIELHSDSQYVTKGMSEWIQGWKRNGWRTSTKKPVLNKDLWLRLDGAASGRKISWKHVLGHSDIAGNERCDVIATSFADNEKIDLYNGNLSAYPIKGIV